MKRLVEIGDDDLQNVAVDGFGVGAGRLKSLHLAQLLNSADRPLFLLIGFFAFGQAVVVEATTTLKRRLE